MAYSVQTSTIYRAILSLSETAAGLTVFSTNTLLRPLFLWSFLRSTVMIGIRARKINTLEKRRRVMFWFSSGYSLILETASYEAFVICYCFINSIIGSACTFVSVRFYILDYPKVLLLNTWKKCFNSVPPNLNERPSSSYLKARYPENFICFSLISTFPRYLLSFVHSAVVLFVQEPKPFYTSKIDSDEYWLFT